MKFWAGMCEQHDYLQLSSVYMHTNQIPQCSLVHDSFNLFNHIDCVKAYGLNWNMNCDDSFGFNKHTSTLNLNLIHTAESPFRRLACT